MLLEQETNRFIEAVRAHITDENTVVLWAYPYVRKPTRLKKCYAAVSPGTMTAERAELGGERLFGEYGIVTELFVPQEYGSQRLHMLAAGVMEAARESDAVRIEMDEPKQRDALGAYSLTVKASFSDEISTAEQEA